MPYLVHHTYILSLSLPPPPLLPPHTHTLKDITILTLTCSVTVTSVKMSGVGWILLISSALTQTCLVMMTKEYSLATLTTSNH